MLNNLNNPRMVDFEVMHLKIGSLAGDGVDMDQPRAEMMMKTLGLWESGEKLLFVFHVVTVTREVRGKKQQKVLATVVHSGDIQQGDRVYKVDEHMKSLSKKAAKRSALKHLISTILISNHAPHTCSKTKTI